MRGLNRLPRQYCEWLRSTRWSSLLGYAFLAAMFCKLLLLMLPAALRHGAARPIGLAPLLLIIAKALAQFPDMQERQRAVARRGAGWAARIGALPPPELLGMLRLNVAWWRGFACWVRRRPYAARPRGLALTFLERGSYSTLVAAVLVSTFTEIPVGGLIASVIVKDPGTRHALHLVLGLLCGWTLVCVLGDRWLVRAGCHVLTETELDLQVGARAAGCVPIEAVERCELLRETPAEWLARHGLRLRDTLTVTPLDRPNVVLVLRPDTHVSILHCQMERNPSCIFLYLDRPEALSAALAAERGAASCRSACADRVVTGLVRV